MKSSKAQNDRKGVIGLTSEIAGQSIDLQIQQPDEHDWQPIKNVQLCQESDGAQEPEVHNGQKRGINMGIWTNTRAGHFRYF